MTGVQADVATVQYWERNARWYELWAEHSGYHEAVLKHLMPHVAPHWRVLDIGAGNGALSFPLAAIGCEVTALEPAAAMRRLFFRQAWRRGIGHVAVDGVTWEEFSARCHAGYDLVVACNSLHVCGPDMTAEFLKITRLNPRHIFVVTEKETTALMQCARREGYVPMWSAQYETQSPYVYRSLDEAFEHWQQTNRNLPGDSNCCDVALPLRFRGGHWFLDEKVKVALFWWTMSSIHNDATSN